jgi:hypothetical protein
VNAEAFERGEAALLILQKRWHFGLSFLCLFVVGCVVF